MKYEISKYNPCPEAIIFRAKYDSFEEAWNACERGDWMLWLAQQIKVDLRVLTLAKARCAELVMELMKGERSRKAVLVAIAFGQGKATRKELDAAATDAAFAAYAANANAAFVYRIHAANADAANAAYAAAYAAVAAAAAADANADAANAAAILKKSAQICREVFGDKVIKLLLTEKDVCLN